MWIVPGKSNRSLPNDYKDSFLLPSVTLSIIFSVIMIFHKVSVSSTHASVVNLLELLLIWNITNNTTINILVYLYFPLLWYPSRKWNWWPKMNNFFVKNIWACAFQMALLVYNALVEQFQCLRSGISQGYYRAASVKLIAQ